MSDVIKSDEENGSYDNLVIVCTCMLFWKVHSLVISPHTVGMRDLPIHIIVHTSFHIIVHTQIFGLGWGG